MRNKYKNIIIDPPWNQGKTGKRKVRPNQTQTLDYITMSKEQLAGLPIEEIAEENSFLWLWATNSKDKATGEPILKMAFELMEAWGFSFYTMITWDKKTGPCPFGPYQIVTEYILFGYKGKAKFQKEHLGKMKNIFIAKSTGHSIKPREFYENINKHFNGSKIDIFARGVREGFDGWGDEYEGVSKLGDILKKKNSNVRDEGKE